MTFDSFWLALRAAFVAVTKPSAAISKTARQIAFAELIEREFGGFVPPPMFDD